METAAKEMFVIRSETSLRIKALFYMQNKTNDRFDKTDKHVMFEHRPNRVRNKD